MVDVRFSGTETWMVAVTRALLHPGARDDLHGMMLDPEALLAVARVEASNVGPNGVSTLTHEQLGEIVGLSRSAVCRSRLFLTERGLESLVAAPGGAGRVLRRLHDEPDL